MSECPTCGESFDSERGMKVHHSRTHGETLRETKVCEYCGDEFSVYNPHANVNRYCSRECKNEDQITRETRECQGCSRSYTVQPSSPVKYCCHSCYAESDHDRPRPDDTDSILWVLYRYEGFSIRETWRRQRAVLGVDECLSETQVRDKLDELGIKREYHTGRWSLKDANPEDIGESKPEGDDSWKRLQRA